MTWFLCIELSAASLISLSAKSCRCNEDCAIMVAPLLLHPAEHATGLRKQCNERVDEMVARRRSGGFDYTMVKKCKQKGENS